MLYKLLLLGGREKHLALLSRNPSPVSPPGLAERSLSPTPIDTTHQLCAFTTWT